ncbi:MAG TPA: M13 family metallopeptidase [Gemmatimonadaceae bacterium]|nr:M13 family metallopeptidase [Gemmatimonadaceae bacterium]
MSIRGSLLALFALLVSALPLGAQSAVPMPAFDPSGIDRKYGACTDFFMFANNGWIERNPIPPAFSSWGAFNELTERNTLVLKNILERAAAQEAVATDSGARKLGTFYATCMDSAAAERAGIEPIAEELRRIESITDRAQLGDQVARMHSLGYGGAFGFGSTADPRDARRSIAYATQGGLGLPDRDYYLRVDADAQSLRARYGTSIAAMFALAGDSAQIAAARAARVLDLETALAKAQLSRVALRNPGTRYHHLKVAEASALMAGFDWSRYFGTLGLGQVAEVTINAPPFFSALGTALTTRPLEDWKSYLRWTVLWRSASQLGTPFVDESFRLSSMLTGAREPQPRWRRCLVAADLSLGDALGREYVKTEFTPAAKAKMLEIVGSLRAVLRERISRADWMSERTRAQALAKLEAFNQKIGYPDRWQDYAGLDVQRDSYAANVRRARAYQVRRDVARIGSPVDRDQWLMTAPTVNAYYSASLNEIAFPAGRLQPPFFSVEYDDPANYGGIGATIGHELSHGFDDSGRKYDAVGNVRDWWTAEDARRYGERASVVERQYGAYVVLDTLRINGRLTLGENIADVVGVSIAHEAMGRAMRDKPRTTIDGFTPAQRFFLAYARARLTVLRPEAARMMLATDPHSPGRFRVNGPLSNMPEFAEAFGCKEGDAMVRPAGARARIW